MIILSKGGFLMESRPANIVKALSFLLQQWVATTFPPQNRDVGSLNHLWLSLAEALCESHKSKLALFQHEIAQLRPTEKAGYPPVHALEERIYELIDAGLRELFLVIAVRQAMEQLILIEFPASLDEWKQLADIILPLKLQFAHMPDEMPGSTTFLKPDK
jgi:hypothetical protein